MKLSVIIVNFRTPDMTNLCLASLNAGSSTEIIVVDNHSGDGSAEKIRSANPGIKLVESAANLGFAGGCRLGVEEATGEYLVFINSDCLAAPNALDSLIRFLDENPDVAAAVPRLFESNGEVQNNAARLPTLKSIAREYLLGQVASWYKDLPRWEDPTPVESFSGAAVAIRRTDYLAAGGFPERYFMYVEDVELSFQLGKLGKRIVYLPTATLTHHGGGSSSSNRKALNVMLHRNRRDYALRHFGFIKGVLAWAVIWVGLAIMKLKYAANRLIRR